MAQLSTAVSARAANPFSFSAADPARDTFQTSGREMVLVRHVNDAGTSVDLTVVTTAVVDGESVQDKVITIASGENHLLGPFNRKVYGDPDDKVTIQYSDATDIEVAVLRKS
jgi:hypothetical protein